jgi:hypothetical protein
VGWIGDDSDRASWCDWDERRSACLEDVAARPGVPRYAESWPLPTCSVPPGRTVPAGVCEAASGDPDGLLRRRRHRQLIELRDEWPVRASPIPICGDGAGHEDPSGILTAWLRPAAARRRHDARHRPRSPCPGAARRSPARRHGAMGRYVGARARPVSDRWAAASRRLFLNHAITRPACRWSCSPSTLARAHTSLDFADPLRRRQPPADFEAGTPPVHRRWGPEVWSAVSCSAHREAMAADRGPGQGPIGRQADLVFVNARPRPA